MVVFLGRSSVASSRPCWLNTRCRRPFPDSRQSSSWNSASERAKRSRADAAILGGPAYTHLVYRSGVRLVDTTVIGGRLTWQAG
jgi:hypothetical protein